MKAYNNITIFNMSKTAQKNKIMDKNFTLDTKTDGTGIKKLNKKTTSPLLKMYVKLIKICPSYTYSK